MRPDSGSGGASFQELPDDIVRFKPGLNGFFTLDAGKFILELRGLKSGADFFFALGQNTARTDLCGAGSFAETG